MHHSSSTPGAACGVSGVILAGILFLTSPLSVSQAAHLCPNNNSSKPCSLAAAFETCETYIDQVYPAHVRRCKIPGDTSCHWCGVRGSPPIYVVNYYWTTSGVPGWTWNTGKWYVGSHKADARKNLGQPEFCPVGNPINQATGNKFQVETDYASPVPGGLEFRRYYNSLAPTHGRLGTHWRSTYDRRLDTRYHESTLTMIRPDGKHHVFWQSTTGGWQSEADTAHRLEALVSETGNLNGWAYRNADDTLEVYDLQGRLVSIATRGGRTQSLHYDAEHHLETVTGSFGRVLRFAYDSAQRLVSMTDPGGGRYRYDYDDQGRLTAVHYPDDTARHYLYEDPAHGHALTGILDEHGTRFATWAYDSQGRAVSSEHAGGAERVTLTYHSDGTTSVADALGAHRTYRFTTRHGVIKPNRIAGDACTGCGGVTQTFDYDAHGRIEAKRDRNGNLTRYEYNNRGLQISRTEAADTPEARTVSTAWHPDYRLPTRIDAPGKLTEFTYDDHGRLHTRSERDPATGAVRAWAYTYTAEGLLDTVDGPRTDVQDITDHDYDAQGNRIRTTNALGHLTQITAHDAHGRPLTLIDPNGVTTTFDYDARGRTLGEGAEAARTEFVYDRAGKLKRLILPNGARLEYAYDGAQRLIGLGDGRGNRIEYTLDAMGQRTGEAVYDAEGTLRRTRAWVYNQLGRMIESINAGNQSTGYAYDANGNQTALSDASGRVTTQAFDALNRRIRVTDPLGGVTAYAYDAQDRPIAITDPRGLTTRYRYDGFGNRLEQDSPDTGLSTYSYDAAGNRLTHTDARGITAAYRYDALNRLTAVHYPDSGLNVTFGYDQGEHGIGRLSTMRDASGTSEYRYDARGNLIEALSLLQGARYSTQYRYDSADKLIQIRYPSGRTVDYARNPAGAIRAVSTAANRLSETLAEAIEYAPFGGRASLDYGNGLSAAYRYDLDGRLSALTAAPLHDHEYAYDPVGNITAISDTLDPAARQTFAYDDLDRLSGETGPYGARDYAYDALGNRTQRIRQDLRTEAQGHPVTRTRTQDYVYDDQANRLVRINRRPHRYDAAGNLISDRNNRRQFSYDDNGRLGTFTRRATLKASYRYDGKGRRVLKLGYTARGQNATHFHYAPDGRLLAESVYNRKGVKKTVREYLWLDATPLAQFRIRYRNNGKVKDVQKVFLHSDHLNTPRLATDDQQRIVWRWRGDAFGQGRAETDPDGDGRKVNVRLRFPGQYRDAESGLHYNYFRDYDPSTGRYIQSDPIGLDGGLNPFSYVDSNPLSFTDPLGLSKFLIGANASFQQTAAGASVSGSVGVDTTGNVCFEFQVCGRVGPGISAGATFEGTIAEGEFCAGNSISGGFFGEGGIGPFGGGGLAVGADGLSSTLSAKGGFGGGAAGGTQVCITRTICPFR